MKNKVFIIMVLLLGLTSLVFSTESISCTVRDNSCVSPEVPFLYTNGNFVDGSGNPNAVLSSNSAVYADAEYNKVVCCKSNLGKGNLETSFVSSTVSCPGTGKVDDLLHFTSDTNARIGFREIMIDDRTIPVLSTDYNFNLNHYNKTLCVKIPDTYSSFSLMASHRDLGNIGYTCLFRTSGLINGVVGACDATFNSGNKYTYTIWGRLNENENTMQCNNDCTSKLDNRVYSICGDKILGCENVPPECDGSLLNSWVSNGTVEKKCASPWDIVRTKTLSSNSIEVSSTEPICDNIIMKKFPVIVDNEIVNMRVYTCSN